MLKNNHKVLVTGGNGFLGKHLKEELKKYNVKIYTPSSEELDLLLERETRSYMIENQFDVVIHLAAVVGGIGANKENPAVFFEKNMRMGMNVISASKEIGVKKFVFIGTTCSYSKFPKRIPFGVDQLWTGYPEETNAPYGIAKKSLMVMGDAYRAQYGFNFISLIPTNLFGPHDNFELNSSHVIPAVIRKIDNAIKQGEETVTLWGDGSPSRDFLFVEDCARIIAELSDNYDRPEPLNIGSGNEIYIYELVNLIVELMGYKGEVKWDIEKPNGQPRRCLDITDTKKYLKEYQITNFKTALKKTIEYWQGVC